jgi:hypothetical protein
VAGIPQAENGIGKVGASQNRCPAESLGASSRRKILALLLRVPEVFGKLPLHRIVVKKEERVVGASNRTVLHAGCGGAGWRKEKAGCTGRRSKCKVRRSNACSLCSTASAMVFILDGECITLSSKCMLNIKGARVELVQPDGMHLWLWNVSSDALCSVAEAFARMREASAV